MAEQNPDFTDDETSDGYSMVYVWGKVYLWGKLVAHVRRVARLRRLWSTLGNHLRSIKERGRLVQPTSV
jgi:hypothetical protein